MKNIVIRTLGALCLLSISAATFCAEGLPSDIITAFEARQREVRSARVVLDISQSVSTDLSLYPEIMRPPSGSFRGEGPPRPPYLSSDYRTVLTFDGVDGKRVRYETNRPTFSLSTGEFISDSTRSVYNGTESKTVSKLGSVAVPYGRIDDPELGPLELGNVELRPIILVCRLFAPMMGGFKPSEFSDTGRHGVVGAHKCAILNIHSASSRAEMWVERSVGSRIVRYIERNSDGQHRYRIDMRYDENKEVNWLPSGWDTLWFSEKDSARVREMYRATVTDCDLNVATADSLYQLNFAPGTIVTDHRRSSSGKTYVVQSSGRFRPISDAEIVRIGKEGEAALAALPTRSRNRLLFAATGLVVATGIGYAGYFFLRRNRAHKARE